MLEPRWSHDHALRAWPGSVSPGPILPSISLTILAHIHPLQCGIVGDESGTNLKTLAANPRRCIRISPRHDSSLGDTQEIPGNIWADLSSVNGFRRVVFDCTVGLSTSTYSYMLYHATKSASQFVCGPEIPSQRRSIHTSVSVSPFQPPRSFVVPMLRSSHV
jgi:hypothetical protein